jgi:uncharacterized peroxidase-related enzyme
MLRVTPIKANQATKDIQQVLEASHVAFEEVPNFLKVLANSVAALKAYVESEEALLDGQLTPRFREQIALAVAEINASNYCLAAHSIAGKGAGLTDEEIRLARNAAASDPKADALLRFTQSVVLQRGKISDEDFCAVGRAGFSKAELVEILANIALNIFTNYLNIVAKTEIDLPQIPTGPEAPGGSDANANGGQQTAIAGTAGAIP